VTGSKIGRAIPFLLLLAGSAVLFLGGLGRLPLLGRDESLYAEAAREMFARGDWITPRVNGGPFFEKPPLYYWLAWMSYSAFGVSPFAARLPAALMAVVTVVLTAAAGARVWGARAGLLAGVALATSLQIALIGRMGIMDVPLTCLTTLALFAYARWRTATGSALIALGGGFGLCVGLAVLLKGMAGLLPVAIAAVHALIFRRYGPESLPSTRGWGAFARGSSVVIAVALFVAVALPWFYLMGDRHGESFGSTLLLREHLTRMAEPMQGHGGPFFYYAVCIVVSFFPWVMFLPPALASRRAETESARALWRSLLIVWFAVVLIPFSLIQTKLPGYVTPLFPAMAMLVGVELDRRLRAPGRAPWVAVIAGAVVLAGLTSLLPALAARLGERVGAAHAASRLVVPVLVWIAGYALIALGGACAVAGRVRAGLGAIIGGQLVAVGAVLLGILPVLSPYLEGGRESGLAELARQELPRNQVVLYDTRPEAVAFVLGRPVPAYGRDQFDRALLHLEEEPVALVAPAKARELWESLPVRRVWQVGDRVLLDVPKISHSQQEDLNP